MKKKNYMGARAGKKQANPLAAGGLAVIALAVIFGGGVLWEMNNGPLNPIEDEPLHIVIPSQTPRGADTQSNPLPTRNWDATTSDTPIPFPTNTPAIAASPQSSDTPIPLPTNTAASIRTFYVVGEYARIRECASTDCEQVNLISRGASIQVVEDVTGDTANGSNVWYRLADGNYVHSSTVSANPPSAQSSNVSTGGGGSNSAAPQATPRNCDEAIAMGLTEQQAGQYPHLDRDGDGVACRGN
jgi:hypothetical protein